MGPRDKKKVMVGGMVVMLASMVINGVFISKNNTLENERNRAILLADSAQAVKQLLTKEYDETKASLEKHIGRNTELDHIILALNKELEAQKEKMSHLAKENASVVLLRKQLAEVKRLRKECEEEVNRIILENDKYSNRLQELASMNASLQTQLDKMTLELEGAKQLKAYNLGARSYKLKKSKAVPTAKARRTHRIAVTFHIFENSIADAGQKKMHAVITDPNGETLVMEHTKFFNKNAGKETSYSAMKEIEYNRSDQRVTMNFDYDKKLKSGKYKVELYADGAYAGKGEFMLK